MFGMYPLATTARLREVVSGPIPPMTDWRCRRMEVSMTEPILTLVERVELILIQHGITPRSDDEMVITNITCGAVGCKLRVGPADQMLRCLIALPLLVPPEQRPAMVELLCRINYNLFSGAFEMDMNDGELRFRNALPLIDGVPTDEQLTWLVFWSWGLVKRYSSALLDVLTGVCSAAEAIAKVEAGGVQLLLERPN
jgi:hypothetical protein